MRILIIEDEKEIGAFLKNNLEAECFSVDWANDGVKGLFMAKTNDYDLILLDYILPKTNGKDICRQLRLEGKTVPIIMLTVKSEIDDKVEMLDLGVDDYLTKPFSYEELFARIQAVLRRPKEINDKVLKVDNLTLDTKSHIVTRANKDIYLSRKEFTLLEYMMKNCNAVLSRGKIMEHVWDMNADPFSNTIESHILSLRKKIDQGHEKKLIKTVQGRGYKISS